MCVELLYVDHTQSMLEGRILEPYHHKYNFTKCTLPL